MLELELQAEVDKYVLSVWLLREQGRGRFPRELHRALFERARIDAVAAAGRIGLYQLASSYAARFCRRVGANLSRRRHGVGREALAELRRFYRWGNARKLRHIEDQDDILVTTPTDMYRYVVVSTRVVNPDEVWVLSSTEDSVLTLITCYPFSYVGNAPQRFIVEAELAAAPARSTAAAQ